MSPAEPPHTCQNCAFKKCNGKWCYENHFHDWEPPTDPLLIEPCNTIGSSNFNASIQAYNQKIVNEIRDQTLGELETWLDSPECPIAYELESYITIPDLKKKIAEIRGRRT